MRSTHIFIENVVDKHADSSVVVGQGSSRRVESCRKVVDIQWVAGGLVDSIKLLGVVLMLCQYRDLGVILAVVGLTCLALKNATFILWFWWEKLCVYQMQVPLDNDLEGIERSNVLSVRIFGQ